MNVTTLFPVKDFDEELIDPRVIESDYQVAQNKLETFDSLPVSMGQKLNIGPDQKLPKSVTKKTANNNQNNDAPTTGPQTIYDTNKGPGFSITSYDPTNKNLKMIKLRGKKAQRNKIVVFENSLPIDQVFHLTDAGANIIIKRKEHSENDISSDEMKNLKDFLQVSLLEFLGDCENDIPLCFTAVDLANQHQNSILYEIEESGKEEETDSESKIPAKKPRFDDAITKSRPFYPNKSNYLSKLKAKKREKELSPKETLPKNKKAVDKILNYFNSHPEKLFANNFDQENFDENRPFPSFWHQLAGENIKNWTEFKEILSTVNKILNNKSYELMNELNANVPPINESKTGNNSNLTNGKLKFYDISNNFFESETKLDLCTRKESNLNFMVPKRILVDDNNPEISTSSSSSSSSTSTPKNKLIRKVKIPKSKYNNKEFNIKKYTAVDIWSDFDPKIFEDVDLLAIEDNGEVVGYFDVYENVVTGYAKNNLNLKSKKS